MVGQRATKDHKGKWNKEIYYRSWRRYRACLEGLPGEVKAGYKETEVQLNRTWGPSFYWCPWVKCFEVPGVRSDWLIQTKRPVVFWRELAHELITRDSCLVDANMELWVCPYMVTRLNITLLVSPGLLSWSFVWIYWSVKSGSFDCSMEQFYGVQQGGPHEKE